MYLRFGVCHVMPVAVVDRRSLQEQKMIKRILCKTTIEKWYARKKICGDDDDDDRDRNFVFFFFGLSCVLLVANLSFRSAIVSVARTPPLPMVMCVWSRTSLLYVCFILLSRCSTLNSNETQNMDKHFIITFGIRFKCFRYVNRVHGTRWTLWISFDRFAAPLYAAISSREHSPTRCASTEYANKTHTRQPMANAFSLPGSFVYSFIILFFVIFFIIFGQTFAATISTAAASQSIVWECKRCAPRRITWQFFFFAKYIAFCSVCVQRLWQAMNHLNAESIDFSFALSLFLCIYVGVPSKNDKKKSKPNSHKLNFYGSSSDDGRLVLKKTKKDYE